MHWNHQEFVFDIDPVPFARPRFNRGRGFQAPKQAKYCQALKHLLLSKTYHTMSEFLRVDTIFTVKKTKKLLHPYPTKCDADNYRKIVLDAFNTLLWDDDRRIVGGMNEKRWGDHGQVHITIRKWE